MQYDPSVTNFPELLDQFWAGHDPTTPAYSRQYMSAIFCHGEEQLQQAKRSMKTAQGRFRKEMTTLVCQAGEFYLAEDYHQKYQLQKHPWLMASLGLERGPGLVDSTLAARLNGYIAGYGTKEGFLGEREALCLTEEQADYVLEAMGETGSLPGCSL